MIINEPGDSLIRSDSVHFASNEQGLFVFYIAHAEQNLIKLKLYNNWSAQAVNISESAMWNSSKPVQCAHLGKLANQRWIEHMW